MNILGTYVHFKRRHSRHGPAVRAGHPRLIRRPDHHTPRFPRYSSQERDAPDRRNRPNWAVRTLAAAAVALGVAQSATAGLLPTSVTVTPDAANYRWTYAIVLPTDSMLRSGDYFTIYDFGGLVPGSIVAPDGWTASVSNSTARRSLASSGRSTLTISDEPAAFRV